jgi:hypothetical protein
LEGGDTIVSSLDTKSIKIKAGDDFFKFSNFDTLPDFNMLPNIPKLVMVASIDDITSVPSLKSRVSSSNAEGSRWSTSDESKRRY